MKDYPKISVVTVNYNNGEFLEDTIRSVVEQNYPNLEYILIDGGSTDNSLEIIKKYEKHFAYWVSEPDEGQYHAIQKGFEKSTGEIMAWLNSDDKFLPRSLFKVAEIMNQFPHVNWLMGFAREYSEDGALFGQIGFPWCRWSRFRYLTNDFQFIQQESTFWSRKLWDRAGGRLDLKYDLAGDLELWSRFFRYEQLITTTFELSGFRHRLVGQKSKEHRSKYLAEAREIIRREQKNSTFGVKLLLPFLYFARFLFGPFFFLDIPLLKVPYRWIFRLPKPIFFDTSNQQFTYDDRRMIYPSFMLGKRQVHRKMFSEK